MNAGSLHTPRRVGASLIEDVVRREVPGVRVGGIEITPVGTGQVAAAYRITVDYAGDVEGPRSLVLKCPSPDQATRDVARQSRSYEVESRFYDELAQVLEVNTPRVWLSEHDTSTGEFILLMGDAAPAQAGDQLSGISPADAARAIDELALLHAARWNNAGPEQLPWIRRRASVEPGVLGQVVKDRVDAFFDRYAEAVGEQTRRLRNDLAHALTGYLAHEPVRRSLVHADFRADNLLFRSEEGTRPLVVDWGGLAEGAPLSDLSYFLGGSLLVEDRRAFEGDLVERYAASLASNGVTGMSVAEMQEDYALHSFSGMSMAVMASTSVRRTPRGDHMFVAMADRHAVQISDLDSMDLLSSLEEKA